MLPELLQKLGVDVLSHPSLLGLSIFLIGFASYEVVRYLARFKGFSGPLGLPILGNLWQIRGVDAPELYRSWSKKYGAVYQIQLGNIPVLVINKAAAAKAILVQNSHATGSRPEFYTFHKVCLTWFVYGDNSQCQEIISSTSSTTLGTAPYNDSLKRRRKAAASALNRPAVESYVPHLDEETKIFLTEAYNYGQGGRRAVDPMPLFLRLNLTLSLTLHWGDRMTSQSDLFREIVHVEDKISGFRSTTGNLPDYVPLLRLNPFSMASEAARQMRNRRDKYMHNLDENLDRKMETGEHNSCIRANIKLDSEAKLNDTELASLNVTMLAAGLDTMNSAVSFGIAMLATKPEIQAKAFAAVRERYSENALLCDAKDQQTCEYVVAMVKEILRSVELIRFESWLANSSTDTTLQCVFRSLDVHSAIFCMKAR